MVMHRNCLFLQFVIFVVNENRSIDIANAVIWGCWHCQCCYLGLLVLPMFLFGSTGIANVCIWGHWYCQCF